MADAVPTAAKTPGGKGKATGGEPAAAQKRKAKPREVYPGLLDEKGEPTKKLTEYPADYDPRKHKGLSRKSFVNEAPFLRHQANVLRDRAGKLDAEAVACEKLGSAADRAKAKKLRQMHEVMKKLSAELSAQGIDVAELMAGDAEPAKAELPKEVAKV